ncbi:protein ARV 2-like isoform X3 [Nymphaea colorata]|uniref:protein ARV 2-like isoform X3 n=1 Tax=Nymphaea colorata TaxID=210225 RepID=UPI00129DDCFD|nr:protein ARV 2-like isoform X3 [Nymphaea colorata]
MVPPKEMNFRCIHCGFPVETLFIQYSPGNIRLMKCENCRSVADEYIECEIMILLIDLVLHKSKAYHHLLNNFPKLNGVYLELLLSSFFGILVFLCILYPACKYLQKSPRKAIRFNQVLLATLVSSYFKIVLIAMMVWQFPVTAIFIIDMFALSSNAVALKVLMQITMVESVAACIIAHSAKLLVNYIALLAI